MSSTIYFIKEITADEIIVSAADFGDTVVLSTKDLTDLHRLDIGPYAQTACVSDKHLYVGNGNGVHIFNLNKNYKKMAEHGFGETLTAMTLFTSQLPDDQQYIVCGTYNSKVFLVEVKEDPTVMK